jgi:hypothetical protein
MGSSDFKSKLLKCSLENVNRNSIAANNVAHKTNIVQPVKEH